MITSQLIACCPTMAEFVWGICRHDPAASSWERRTDCSSLRLRTGRRGAGIAYGHRLRASLTGIAYPAGIQSRGRPQHAVLPYGELERNRDAMAGFGQGMRPIEAMAKTFMEISA